MGVEPMTYSLQSWCSTAELKRRVVLKGEPALKACMGVEPTTYRVETDCTIHCANRPSSLFEGYDKTPTVPLGSDPSTS